MFDFMGLFTWLREATEGDAFLNILLDNILSEKTISITLAFVWFTQF